MEISVALLNLHTFDCSRYESRIILNFVIPVLMSDIVDSNDDQTE